MEVATLPNINYTPTGINTSPLVVPDLFRHETIYRNSNNGFAVEFQKQMIGLHDQGFKLSEIAEEQKVDALFDVTSNIAARTRGTTERRRASVILWQVRAWSRGIYVVRKRTAF